MTNPCFHFKPYWIQNCCCGATVCASGAWTALAFNTSGANGDLQWDNATSTHTVPVTAMYELSTTAYSNTNDNGVGTFRSVAFDVDGDKYGVFNHAPATGTKWQLSAHTTKKMGAGSVVSIQFYQDSGANMSVLENKSSFCILRLWTVDQEH